jgi:putative ABC transport system permease protein
LYPLPKARIEGGLDTRLIIHIGKRPRPQSLGLGLDCSHLDDVVDESMANQRFTLILFTSFAAVALFLDGLGIYGVMSFSVAQRAHEIALRRALGATRDRVVGLIIHEGVLLAAIGLGLGLIGAYFVGRAMQSLLFGVQALDFGAFISVAAVLLAAAVLACFLPARRAASVSPMRVLRTE